MKRKILYGFIVALLAVSYYMVAIDTPYVRYEFKYPHWTLKSKLSKPFSMKEIGFMDFRCFDKDGNLLWEELDRPNNLADEGEELFLDVVLREGTAPANFYLRLFNDTPVDTDNLTSLTGEPTQFAYTAQTIPGDTTGWPTLALDSGDFQATSTTETFTATGGSWGPVTYCVLTTSIDNAGKHVSYVALSQSRTLADGETLQVTYKLKLQ